MRDPRGDDDVIDRLLSSQAKGAPIGAHADFVAPRDCERLPEVVPQVPFDCMLEAQRRRLARRWQITVARLLSA
jgi:hypothetical protein